MIFIPNKDNKKLGFVTGKGIKMSKENAEKFEKAKLGVIKKASKKK